jgi:hypothetical protein
VESFRIERNPLGLENSCKMTYGEVLGDIVLDETDISCVTGASSLLVSLVLVTHTLGGEESSRGEARSGSEGRGESDKGHEEEDDFSEHCRSILC